MTTKEIEKRLDRLENKLKTAKEVHYDVLQSYQNQINNIRENLKKMMTTEQEVISHIPHLNLLDYPVSPMDAFSKDKYFFSKVTNQPDPASWDDLKKSHLSFKYQQRKRVLQDLGFKYAESLSLARNSDGNFYYRDGYRYGEEDHPVAKITTLDMREYLDDEFNKFIKWFKEAKSPKLQPITTDNAIICSSFDRRSSELIAKEGHKFIIDEDYTIKVKNVEPNL